MDNKERIALIRKGNEFFNQGKIKEAIEIFVKTGYKDGLQRIGDYYYYDKKLPLIALKFYRMSGSKKKIDEIMERMIFALGKWLGNDKVKDSPFRVKLPPLKVSPKLKMLAQEILEKHKEEENK
ncbi:MAG: hypothetical protein GYA16_04215 [Spirochaetes bacterium]|nr:hypothetical protein [Spirochaetota bacterium]